MSREQEKCPWCGKNAYAEFVDVGVGHQRVTAWTCEDCKTSELFVESRDSPALSEIEKQVGWYLPDGADEFQAIAMLARVNALQEQRIKVPLPDKPIIKEETMKDWGIWS